MFEVKGIIVPIVTPFDADERVNEAELRRQVRRQLEAGVHGVFPLGTNGEAYILEEQEKLDILRIVVDEVNGKVPVYAGTGCIGTEQTIRLSRAAQAIGVDALSIITPSFAAASQEALYAHYAEVAEAVKLPIVLYNIPARTGNALQPETVARLSRIANIVGAKDSSGKFENIVAYIEQAQEGFAVLSGNDALILDTLQHGGKGGIAGCANVFPRHMVSIYEAYQAGNMALARKQQEAIQLFRDTFRFGNPNTMVKKAVQMLGYDVGECRRPFGMISTDGCDALRVALVRCAERNMH